MTGKGSGKRAKTDQNASGASKRSESTAGDKAATDAATSPDATSQQPAEAGLVQLIRRHAIIGWVAVLLFMLLGGLLEFLHSVKAPLYLDVRHASRRLMWTLAHSHGTLFGLMHVAFAATLSMLTLPANATLRWAGACLTAGLIAMPVGFFLGGAWLLGEDPGLGILLAPVGAGFVIAGVGLVLIEVLRSKSR